MRVIIMGCGRVGAGLATAMAQRGHDVVVVDRDEAAFARLGESFTGKTIRGVGFDRDVLVKAGIESADAFAAVSSGDNSNIIAARVARESFGIDRVVARIYDAKRAAVYERLGIPTVATVPWTTERFITALDTNAEPKLWRDPTGALVLDQLDLNDGWIGVSCQHFADLTGARIAYLQRLGRPILPDARSVLQSGDVVYVLIHAAHHDAVRAMTSAPPIDGGDQ